MEIKDFIVKFAEQYDDVNVDNLSPETNFRDVEGWSSLVALSVIAMVDEEYDVSLKGDDISNHSTIQELFNVVKGRL